MPAKTMKAMMSHAVGGPETLELTERPVPQPKSGEVLIRAHAAGVNFPDTLIGRDLYQIKPPRPFAPGGELAGIVEAVGDSVDGFAVGDRVLALTLFGAFSSHVCAKASMTFKIPDAMPFDEASCFILTYGTNYYGLHDCGRLRGGETVLVLGASGGIGTAAIELAKQAKARVIAAASSEEKAAFCRELGADETLIYPSDLEKDGQRALSTSIKELAGNKGIDIVYDPVGGNYAEPALRSLNFEGRHVVLGFTAGIPKIPLNLPLLKNLDICGVNWAKFIAEKPDRFRDQTQTLLELYDAGEIKQKISARFPLAEAGKALELFEARQARGKIVVMID
ncbi:MAG: NADPH:quinone oxidoreductase family protein [Hyphomicrobiales bacterium]